MAIRARRRQGMDVTDAELRWANGEPDAIAANGGELFFTTPTRLREVFELVHGEPFGAWLGRHPEIWRSGTVLFGSAVVGRLSSSDVEVLEAGGSVSLSD